MSALQVLTDMSTHVMSNSIEPLKAEHQGILQVVLVVAGLHMASFTANLQYTNVPTMFCGPPIIG